MRRERSAELWRQACRLFPGGVNSPVRAFRAVGGEPFFAARGEGSYVYDVDGNRYIDYVLSWGPLVLGHAHPEVVEAIIRAAQGGSSFGIPTEAEGRLAEVVTRFFPAMEKIRFVNSGTEASMSAIRLARAFTGRDRIVKIEGCYHGHVDALLVKAGSGLATFGVPTSPGIPADAAADTLTAPYNDVEAIEALFATYSGSIACVILEPVPGNMGVVLPEPGYLEHLRRITRRDGALLVFDEVMSGFRVAMGGAQARFGIQPDLTLLGKAIGGGLPVGAYGGSAGIMDMLAPSGPVYQAGTLSGNPLAMAAGHATLDVLSRPGIFDSAAAAQVALGDGLVSIARETGIPACVNACGSMGCMFFNENPVRNYKDAACSDTVRYGVFFKGMLERGVYFAPSQFEACFTSTAHTEEALAHTLAAARDVFRTLA